MAKVDPKFEEMQSIVKTIMLEFQSAVQKMEADLQLLIQVNKARLLTQTQVSRLEREAKKFHVQLTAKKKQRLFSWKERNMN